MIFSSDFPVKSPFGYHLQSAVLTRLPNRRTGQNGREVILVLRMVSRYHRENAV